MHARGAIAEDAAPQSVRHLAKPTIEDVIATEEAADAGDAASVPNPPRVVADADRALRGINGVEEEGLGESAADGFQDLFAALGFLTKKSKAQPPAAEHIVQGVIFHIDEDGVTLSPLRRSGWPRSCRSSAGPWTTTA